ncbi:MAG: hypothetical protein E3J21_20145 [Anaerolineales bacterium]|nr:MAG: hypothetical protein E3J21_20145 [Anaerolineales bacterium]
MTQSQPPITRTTHTLPFDKLSPRDFERLCLWLVEREGYQRAHHLGLDYRQCLEYCHRPDTQHGVSPNAAPSAPRTEPVEASRPFAIRLAAAVRSW